jgi:hypothetical protein
MGQVDDKDLTQLFCSRSTQVLKDEKRKTLSINSGPTWLRFPGPNNPPIKDRDYYQAFGHTQRPAAQVQQQVSNTLWRNPVVNLPHASNYAKVHRSSFSDQAHTQPYQPLHSWYSSNTHQPLHGPRGLHQPFAHHLPRRPLQPVIPLRESSCSSGPNLPMRLSIPPSMILPPNHPHSMSIPRMSPTKADDQRPLPRLPGYPVPPPPAAGYQ